MKNNDNNMISMRLLELYRESEYAPSVSDFLSPGEIVSSYRELTARIGSGVSGCFFWGGCRGAERCSAIFLPEWYMPEGAPGHRMPASEERSEFFAEYLASHPEILEEIPIKAISIKGSGFRVLTHRDFMGSILSLGVSRSVIGDITVVSESEAIVMVQDRIAEYVCTELKKIGRDGVKCEVFLPDPMYKIKREFEESVALLASMRLDCAVKAVTGLSREDSAELVRGGLVELSYSATTDVSADVTAGDVISVRGYGKYVVGDTVGRSSSGRLKVKIKKYV